MYLVHTYLELPSGGELPCNIRTLVRSAIIPRDGVEHVAVHTVSSCELTLGFYLLAGALEEAEERAVRATRRLLRAVPELATARPTGAGVPLIPLAFEPHEPHEAHEAHGAHGAHEPQTVDRSGPRGRIGPRPLPSIREPFPRA
ncbi:hypothetical protein ACFYXJ_07485 [Streptomyces sp. NPDC002667]|uniref:hypothetical protein n=1 Tax=Streptomyces sp. NPDC002667 TaxID=3364657 RepID=UPI00368F61FA